MKDKTQLAWLLVTILGALVLTTAAAGITARADTFVSPLDSPLATPRPRMDAEAHTQLPPPNSVHLTRFSAGPALPTWRNLIPWSK